MMRPALPLLLVAALAACAPATSPAPASEPVPSPVGTTDKSPSLAAVPKLHAFTFFVSDLQSRDPRIVEYIQSDCGTVAITHVKAIPVDDDLILPDIVVQYDETGAEVHRWSKSYSSQVLAISGDQMFFGASPGGDPGPFRTTPAGDVTVAVPLATNLEAGASYVNCPAALASFPDMSLVSCYETTDVAGRKLNLAWEAGCP
jgi:hypothetical protein